MMLRVRCVRQLDQLIWRRSPSIGSSVTPLWNTDTNETYTVEQFQVRPYQ